MNNSSEKKFIAALILLGVSYFAALMLIDRFLKWTEKEKKHDQSTARPSDD
jgi:hypothetical protein